MTEINLINVGTRSQHHWGRKKKKGVFETFYIPDTSSRPSMCGLIFTTALQGKRYSLHFSAKKLKPTQLRLTKPHMSLEVCFCVCDFHSITRLLTSSKVRTEKAGCTQSSVYLFTLQIKRQRKYNDSLRPNTSGAQLELTASI